MPLQQAEGTLDEVYRKFGLLQTHLTSNSRQNFHNVFQVNGNYLAFYYGQRSVKNTQLICGCVRHPYSRTQNSEGDGRQHSRICSGVLGTCGTNGVCRWHQQMVSFLPIFCPQSFCSKGTDLLLLKSLSGGRGSACLFDVQVLGLLVRGDSSIFVSVSFLWLEGSISTDFRVPNAKP